MLNNPKLYFLIIGQFYPFILQVDLSLKNFNFITYFVTHSIVINFVISLLIIKLSENI